MTLNRPKHLNVLSTEMISKMHAQLNSWVYSDVPTRQIDPKIDLLILEANYDNQKTRSFCAGGDVREMTQGGLGNQTGKNFMFHEYQFDLKLAEMFQKTKIPLITFLDGIVMGGGVGISIHSQYKIVTENTKFAMPETSIGLFRDGKRNFLVRMTGRSIF